MQFYCILILEQLQKEFSDGSRNKGSKLYDAHSDRVQMIQFSRGSKYYCARNVLLNKNYLSGNQLLTCEHAAHAT